MWYESLADKKVLFPIDIEEVPDIIFYYADENEESRRHCFARIKYNFMILTTINH